MAKGIIVVEMPEKCGECVLSNKIWHGDNLEVECPFMPYSVESDNIPKNEKYCPIRPMPERKEIIHSIGHCMDFSCSERASGWNDCVDYLEGKNGE